MPTDYDDAARRIAKYEDLSTFAGWDVNAFRLGYGSDTQGPEQAPVRPYDWTTKEAALANLALRIKEFERIIVGQVGEEAWGKLSPAQQTSLLSFGYNYGHLTPSVAAAVRRGDVAAIGEAIRSRGADNKGVNDWRRKDEATAFQPPRRESREGRRHGPIASPSAHFHAASVHHAVTAALALGPGTYSASHRHKAG